MQCGAVGDVIDVYRNEDDDDNRESHNENNDNESTNGVTEQIRVR